MRHDIHFLKAFLYFFHSTVTIIVSFLPLFYKEKGLSGWEIGILLGLGPFISMFVQPLWGYLSDKYKSVKKMLLICLFGMIVSSLFMFQQETFFAFLITGCVFFAFMSPVGALGDSLTQKTAHLRGRSFGSIRMWGSLGFASGAVVSGTVFARIGVDNILYPYLISASLAFIICSFITDVKVSDKPVRLMHAMQLSKNSKLAFFLLLIVFISVTHRMNDSYLGIYIDQLGGSKPMIGWAWAIGVTTEAIVFATSVWWFRRYHELTFIFIAGLIYSIRFILVSMIDDPYVLLFLQPLHGVTFGIFYVSAFQYVTKIVPKELQSTGQLLLVSIFFGLSGILGALLGGAVIDRLGGAFLYQTMGLVALIGSVNIFLYMNVMKRKRRRMAGA